METVFLSDRHDIAGKKFEGGVKHNQTKQTNLIGYTSLVL
jgi:hypothetical protein